MKTPINWIDSYLQASAQRLIIRPTNDPIPATINTVLNASGGQDITITWTYTQGITPAHGFILYVVPSHAVPTASNSTPFEVDANTLSYTWLNVSVDSDYRVGIAAYTIVNDVKYVGNIIAPTNSPNWQLTASVPNYTGELGGVLVADILNDLSSVNYNFSNDNNPNAIAAPTNLVVSHSENTNGSVDGIITWSWAGTNGDIDGFAILSKSSTTNSVMVLDSSAVVQTTFADRRTFRFPGIAPDLWYKVGILAYRVVNKNISPNALLTSTLVQAANYQPMTSPNYTGRIGGVTVAQLLNDLSSSNYNFSNDNNPDAIPALTSVSISHTANTDGSVDATVSWAWPGTNADIDGFAIVFKSSSTNSVMTLDATANIVTTMADRRSFVFNGVSADKWYKVGVLAYRVVNQNISANSLIVSSMYQLSNYRPMAAPNYTGLIGNVSVNDLLSNLSSVNYNTSNDNNSDVIVDPTGISLSHTVNTNGSVNGIVTWTWTGTNSDIDGFLILVKSSTTNVAMTLDSTSTAFTTLADRRSYTFFGITPDLWYKVGVQAYRIVNKNINPNAFLISALIQSSNYQPMAAPNYTGLIGGTSVSSILNSLNSTNYDTSNDNLATAIAAPTGVSLSHTVNTNGSVDGKLTWSWSGSNADIDGFAILVKSSTTNSAMVLDGNATTYTTLANARSYTFQNIAPDLWYRVGILAYRVVNKTISANALITSTLVEVINYQPMPAPNYTGNIGGVTVADLLNNLSSSNYNYSNDNNSTAISAPSSITLTHTTNTNGSVDGKVSWVWGGTNSDIDGFAILVKTSTTNSAMTLDVNANIITTFADRRSYTFYNIAPDLWYKVGVLAYRVVNKNINAAGLMNSSITSAANYQPATIPNYTGNINGTSSSSLTTNLNYAYAFSTAMLDDNQITPFEKKQLRKDWDALVAEGPDMNTKAATLGVSVTAYYNAFVALSTWLNQGVTWTTGIPYYITDANLNTNLTLSVGGRTTLKNLINTMANERTLLITTLINKSSTMAAWKGISDTPSAIYNTNDAESIVGNINFSEWSGTYPDTWGQWVGGTPVKETSLVKIGKYSVRFNAVNSQQGIYKTIVGLNLAPNFIISGTIELMLTNRTSGSPAFHIQGYKNNFATPVTNVVATASNFNLNVWQKIPFTLRGDGINTTTEIAVYLMASWNGTGGFVGGVIFDNIQFSIQNGVDFDNRRQLFSDITDTINTSTQLTDNSIDASLKLLEASLTATKTAIAAINPASGNISSSQSTAIKAFYGDLSAFNANLGTVTAGNINTVGYIKINGYSNTTFSGDPYSYKAAIVANDSITQEVGVASYGSMRGVYSYGTSTGVFGTANTNGIGVDGRADGTTGTGVRGRSTNGIGIYGEAITSSGIGGYFTTASGGTALHVNGNMSKTGTGLVLNLNAQYLNGLPSTSFAAASHPHTNYCSGIVCAGGGTANVGQYSGTQLRIDSTVGGYEFYCYGSGTIQLDPSPSDERLKTEILPETLGKDFILSINPVTYKLIAKPLLKHHGFIAQQVHPLINDNSDALKLLKEDGYLAIDYISMIAPLVKAYQELVTEFEDYKSSTTTILTSLQQQIEDLRNAS